MTAVESRCGEHTALIGVALRVSRTSAAAHASPLGVDWSRPPLIPVDFAKAVAKGTDRDPHHRSPRQRVDHGRFETAGPAV